jgi:hypothetical protein
VNEMASKKSSGVPPVAGSEESIARAAQRVISSTEEIIEALIEEARKGSYMHAKFLFDFARISVAPAETRSPEEQSLAALLLSHFRENGKEQLPACVPQANSCPSE